jgi:hypothetical protein
MTCIGSADKQFVVAGKAIDLTMLRFYTALCGSRQIFKKG